MQIIGQAYENKAGQKNDTVSISYGNHRYKMVIDYVNPQLS
jgi:hypothetical protein